MNIEGWVSLHKKILGWEWYSDTNTFRLFIHLLLSANYEAKTWRSFDIERGQLVTSRAAISSAIGLTPQQIRTSETKLILSKSIILKSTNHFCLYSIVKYEEYQTPQTDNNKRITNKQQTDNKPITTTNNITIKQSNKSNNNGGDLFESITLPDWIPTTLWEAYREMRKSKGRGKSLTPYAEQLAIKKLLDLKKAGHDPIAVIEQSIMNSYDGLFPIKATAASSPHLTFDEQRKIKNDLAAEEAKKRYAQSE